MCATDVAGTPQRRAPQDIGLGITSLDNILVEGGERVGQGRGADGFPKRGQADAVDDLEAAVMCDRQCALGSCPPRAHRGRLRLVDVQLQQRAGIRVRPLSARHGLRRAALSLPER